MNSDKDNEILDYPFSEIRRFEIKNSNGMVLNLTNYGARITHIWTPDRNGKMADVTLGFDSVDQYINAIDEPYFGCTVGRCANRIDKGRFAIGDQTYQLETNNGTNHLHGGYKGLDKVIWQFEKTFQGVEFRYQSLDGDGGYPGNLDVTVNFSLTNSDQILIKYSASTDKPTHVNLTNHAYFNLSGEGSGDILSHELEIAANTFTPIDENLIPTGEVLSVANTPFDFRNAKPIRQDLATIDDQLKFAGGYDHNWVLNSKDSRQIDETKFAAAVFDPSTGRTLEVYTTAPAIQFYGGNFLNGKLVGKSGRNYGFREGLCLETQHSPNSPNQPNWPSTLLRPDETFQSQTIYQFLVR